MEPVIDSLSVVSDLANFAKSIPGQEDVDENYICLRLNCDVNEPTFELLTDEKKS